MPRSSRRLHSATISRLKALLSLVENFSNLTLVNAGSTSAKWKHIVAGWTTSLGKGTSTAIGALISTTFASTDVTITAKNPAGGVGPAFWVTDSGNYWSVIHNVISVCQTCTACGSYNSCTYCSSTGTCPAADCNGFGTCPASICNGGYSTCSRSVCLGFGTCSASLCNGGFSTCSSTYCSKSQVSAVQGCGSPYFYSVSVCSQYAYSYKGGLQCVAYTSEPRTGCGFYYTYYTTLCYEYTTYYYNCCPGGYYTYYYTCCDAGYETQYYTCCPGGFYDYTYTCCTGGYYNYTVSCCTGYSTGVSSACGCASYYTYSCNCADNHRIDLSKKESGSETLISSTSNSTTNIVGIKVVTSGNNVTASAYSDTNFSAKIGSDLSTTNSGQKSKDHGIISKASSTAQGYTIDEFRVN
jgi:hypothetical protein